MGSWYQPNMSDKSRYLTPTERRLLEHLVRNAGQIVSHRELLEAVGHPSSSKGGNLLAQYISRLRNKIEIDPALPRVIITHRGLGYSFAGKGQALSFPEWYPLRSVLSWHCGRCPSSDCQGVSQCQAPTILTARGLKVSFPD